MNLRIKELRAEAQELASQEHHTGRSLDLKGMEQQCPDFEIFIARLHTSYEKFAELIVGECIRKIEDIAESSNNPQPIYRVAVELLEHFRVES